MRNDIKAQVSIEFLLLFSLVLLFLTIFTLPLIEISFKNNIDIEKAIMTKNELSKLNDGIKSVYSQGMGSKKIIIIELEENLQINIKNKEITADLLLKEDVKKIRFNNLPSNVDSSLNLIKGTNIIEIYWPLNSDKIIINEK